MIRKIINIDKEKCNGCGICVNACHEGAIGMVDGKATLLREDYCDGLGDCLPACPQNAITFEEREALPYDELAVLKSKELGCNGETHICPSAKAKLHTREREIRPSRAEALPSRLSQWPCQIKLVPVNAPYFDGANLLIAADCAAYAYGNFHSDFMKNHITLIGCPKLDGCDYAEKLTQIISNNNIKSVRIVRMEVPCCSGIESAAKRALMASGKFIPWQVTVISTDGKIIDA